MEFIHQNRHLVDNENYMQYYVKYMYICIIVSIMYILTLCKYLYSDEILFIIAALLLYLVKQYIVYL